MGGLSNRLDGEAWRAFERSYREGLFVTGRVSNVRRGGEVRISIMVDKKRALAVNGFIPESALSHGDIASLYVRGQKVHAKITRIKRDQSEKAAWIELEPTGREWERFRAQYRSGAIVGGKVKTIDAARHRVSVLLHDLELPGTIHRDGMLPCCQKDISHLRDQEVKLCIEHIVDNGVQREIRLRMQRVSYPAFGCRFAVGSELDGAIHTRDENALQILLDEGIIGTVPGATAVASPQIGSKVRVRIEDIRPETSKIQLSLLNPAPRLGRVYWAADEGTFSDKSKRSVVMVGTVRTDPSRIRAVYLSTTGGQIPCAIEKICFLNQRVRIAVHPQPYPLQWLQPYQRRYRGELPQTYQHEIQRRLGSR